MLWVVVCRRLVLRARPNCRCVGTRTRQYLKPTKPVPNEEALRNVRLPLLYIESQNARFPETSPYYPKDGAPLGPIKRASGTGKPRLRRLLEIPGVPNEETTLLSARLIRGRIRGVYCRIASPLRLSRASRKKNKSCRKQGVIRSEHRGVPASSPGPGMSLIINGATVVALMLWCRGR